MTTAVLVGLVLVVALLGVLVAGLLRSHAEILRALHDLGQNLDPESPEAGSSSDRPMAAGVPGQRPPTGSRGRDIVGTTPSGAAAQVAVVGARTPTLLAFLSTSCLTCRGFWHDFTTPDFAPPEGTRLVVVTQGPEGESPAAVERLAPASITTIQSTDAWITYDVPGAPYFALVGTDGTILGEGAATSWERVVDLLGRAQADARHLSRQERAMLAEDVIRRHEHLPTDPGPRVADGGAR